MIGDFESGEFIFDDFKYRTKFEIHFAQWNPSMDLLALASKKGNVIVKRLYWKTGWKIDFTKENYLAHWRSLFSNQFPFLNLSLQNSFEKTASTFSPIESLCWSPDGQILLIAFQNGNFYFLNVQNGKPLFFIDTVRSHGLIRWFAIEPPDQFNIGNHFPINISSTDFNFVENASIDHSQIISDFEHFLNISLSKSLFGSVLCVTLCEKLEDDEEESLFVEVLACGFYSIARFNVTQALKDLYSENEKEVFTSTLEILNIFMVKEENRFDIVCKFCAKKDTVDSQLQVKSDDSQFEYKTSLIHFPFDLTKSKAELYSNIAWRMCRMSFSMAYINEMMTYCTYDWLAQTEAFHRRLFYNMRYVATDLDLLNTDELCLKNLFIYCRDILTAITTGCLSQSICNFLVHDTALKDLKTALIFIDVNFSTLIKGISVGLRPAIYLFKLHLYGLRDVFAKLIDENLTFEHDFVEVKKNPFTSYLTDNESKLLNFEKFKEYFQKLWDSLTELDECFIRLSGIAEINRENLKHFIRFMVLLCINYKDELTAEGDAIIKTFEVFKINYRSLCNFISYKFGSHNPLLTREKTPNLEQENDLNIYEFKFIELYYHRLRPRDNPNFFNENRIKFLNASESVASAKYPLDDVFPILDGESFNRSNDSTYTSDFQNEPVNSLKNLCLMDSLNNVAQSYKNFSLSGIWAFV